MGVTRKSRPNVKVLTFLQTAPSKAWALRAYPGAQEPGNLMPGRGDTDLCLAAGRVEGQLIEASTPGDRGDGSPEAGACLT